jgi:hypothetical protein
MTSRSRQGVYAILAVAAIFVTWYYNIQFMQQYEGFSGLQFITDNYVNPASASIANDITIVLLTFLFWSFFEARKLGMRHWWLYAVLSFCIAIAFTLPLFMLMRERRLAEAQDSA